MKVTTIVPELSSIEIGILAAYTGVGPMIPVVGALAFQTRDRLLSLRLLERKTAYVAGAPSETVTFTPKGKAVSLHYEARRRAVADGRLFMQDQHS